jgi:hypothetical protein
MVDDRKGLGMVHTACMAICPPGGNSAARMFAHSRAAGYSISYVKHASVPWTGRRPCGPSG